MSAKESIVLLFIIRKVDLYLKCVKLLRLLFSATTRRRKIEKRGIKLKLTFSKLLRIIQKLYIICCKIYLYSIKKLYK